MALTLKSFIEFGKPGMWSERQLDDMAVVACRAWAKVFASDKTPSYLTMLSFAEFLGCPYQSGLRDKIVDMHDPEILRKVQNILGPNGYTYLKMLKAQQEPVDG